MTARLVTRLSMDLHRALNWIFFGERKSSFAPNLLSAREFPGVIDSKVASEVALGRIAGPFDSPPVDPLWVSPVGIVPKKIKGEYRMIQHLSYPEGSSVNDGIPRELSTVHYATVDDAVSLIKKSGRGSALAKTDIKSAFRIIPVHGRVFLRRLINITIGVKRPNHYIRITQDVRKDLALWKSFFQSHNGKSMFLEDAWCSSSHLKFYTNAAQSLGFGIVFGRKWAYGKWPADWTHKNIAFLELFPIVLGVQMWGDSLANKRILFFTDNDSVVHVINHQTSKNKELLYLLRQLVLTCLRHNVLFRARHIRGKKNILADCLSRLQVGRFKTLAPDVEASPTVVPSPLLPQNWEKS